LNFESGVRQVFSILNSFPCATKCRTIGTSGERLDHQRIVRRRVHLIYSGPIGDDSRPSVFVKLKSITKKKKCLNYANFLLSIENYRGVRSSLCVDGRASDLNLAASSYGDGKTLCHLCPRCADSFVRSSCRCRRSRASDYTNSKNLKKLIHY
jgi:hypothetical protein